MMYPGKNLGPSALGIAALGLAACLGTPTARADVNVINESNGTLFVSAGSHVNGKVVYGGWTAIQNGQTARVYTGNENRVILSVHTEGANGREVRPIAQNFGTVNLEVASDGYRMVQEGGPQNVWRFTDLTRNAVFFKDNNNNWPNNLPLFSTTFSIVSGTQDQRFIP